MIRLGLFPSPALAVPFCPRPRRLLSGGTTSTTPQAAGIGAAGGALSVSDGSGVDVPAHALKATEEITIEETTLPSSQLSDTLTPVGTAYAFGPDNVTFAEPVTVTLSIDAKTPAGSAT